MEAHRAKQVATLVETLKEERRKYDIRLDEITREHRATIAKLRAEQINEMARKEEMRRSVVHDQGAALMAEIESLRSVLELKSQENTNLRSELDSYRRDIEEKDALQMRLDMAEARCEDLKAQLQRKESFERQISHENEMLQESIHQVSKHNKRLSQRNEELQWKLRNKNDWVSVLANQLNPRLTRSADPEQMEAHSFSPDKNGAPHSSSMMKFMVEKGASVSWTLEIDDLSKGGGSDAYNTLPKAARSCDSATTVSRQGSLRLTANRPVMDTRARSKSISTTCDSARAATVDETVSWNPSFSSTPVSRRHPRKDQSSPSSSSSSSSTSSTASTVNPAVAAAMAAAAAAAAAAADDCNVGGGPRPQEAGGEAMISEETSASSSEDESSTGSDIPRLGMQFAWGKPIK